MYYQPGVCRPYLIYANSLQVSITRKLWFPEQPVPLPMQRSHRPGLAKQLGQEALQGGRVR